MQALSLAQEGRPDSALHTFARLADQGFEAAQRNAAWLLRRGARFPGSADAARAIVQDSPDAAAAENALADWARGPLRRRRGAGAAASRNASAALASWAELRARQRERGNAAEAAVWRPWLDPQREVSLADESAAQGADAPSLRRDSASAVDAFLSLLHDAQAMRLLRLLAARGSSAANTELGLMLAEGTGGATGGHGAAARRFRLGADRGNARAAFELGALYERGLSLARDTPLAKRFYDQAAQQDGEVRARGAGDEGCLCRNEQTASSLHSPPPHYTYCQAWWPARIAVARMLVVDTLRRVGAREEGPWRYALGGGMARDVLRAAWSGPWGLRSFLRTLRARVGKTIALAERRARRMAAEAQKEAGKKGDSQRQGSAAHKGDGASAPSSPPPALSESDADLFLISLLAVSIGVIVMVRAARRRRRQERRLVAAVAAMRGGL